MKNKIITFLRKIFFKAKQESVDIFECVDNNIPEKSNTIKVRIN
jgi:hypothetical protein